MKEYIKNIIAESLKDEVDVDREPSCFHFGYSFFLYG